MSDYAREGEEMADAVVEATGERVSVPAAWLDDENLSRGLVRYEPPTEDVAPQPVPTEPSVDEQPPSPEPVEPPKPPAKGAPKDDWIAWAVHREVGAGKKPAEAFELAAAKTVPELIADYGDPATSIPADSPDEATQPENKE